MHKAMTFLILAGLLLTLAGCGADEPDKKSSQPKQQTPATPASGERQQQPSQQPTSKDGKQWYDYGPGDPRGDIKALQKAKDTAEKIEESRQAPPDDDR